MSETLVGAEIGDQQIRQSVVVKITRNDVGGISQFGKQSRRELFVVPFDAVDGSAAEITNQQQVTRIVPGIDAPHDI